MSEWEVVSDEGQEFRAGALRVVHVDVLDRLDCPLVGVDPGAQRHLRQLLEASERETAKRPISTEADWAIFKERGVPSLARFDVRVDTPRDFEFRLLFEISRHRTALGAASRSGALAVITDKLFGQRARLTTTKLVLRSLIVSNVPTDSLQAALLYS